MGPDAAAAAERQRGTGGPGMATALGAESAEILGIELSRLQNSVAHLERSNDELREALERDGEDEEYSVAIRENEEVLVRLRLQIEELRKELASRVGAGR